MKVLVALSGGLDSAASVLLLRDMGFDVNNIEALFIDMLGDQVAITKAVQTADKLAIKLHIADCADQFKKVVLNHFSNHLKIGRTPTVCAFCNPNFKFKILLKYATMLGFDCIATGHYVKKTTVNNRYYIERGVDPVKDQSYFLWGLTQEQIKKTIFPLGNYTKAQVKKYLAAKNFTDIAVTKESMSLCFVQVNNNYQQFITQNIPLAKGDIIDINGIKVGVHNGFPLYTIGQKKGLELFNPSIKYEVCSINAAANQIIVTQNFDDLYTNTLKIINYSIVDPNDFFTSSKLRVVIRGLGRNPEGFCSVQDRNGAICVTLSNPAWAVAKGQSAVFYIDNRVVGGGEII